MTVKTKCNVFSQLQQKVVTSGIFKGKKDSYPSSIAVPFVDTRISQYSLQKQQLILHPVVCLMHFLSFTR